MFQIFGEQKNLSQWDLDRKLLVLRPCDKVHISNDRKTALVLQPYELDGQTVVNIPNIFLQSNSQITAYAWIEDGDGGYTQCRRTFYVVSKPKPDDYVYTETEVLSFRSLDERVAKLENGLEGQVAAAVEDYMEQNPANAPVQSVNGQTGEVELTAKDVGAISQDDLQAATNEALAQAKASGEFDGAPGEPGTQGPSGNDYILTDADKTEIAGLVNIPTALPNPHALTINGTSYDGSKAVDVTVEGGGGSGEWEKLNKFSTSEPVSVIEFTQSDDGVPYNLVATMVKFQCTNYVTEYGVVRYTDNNITWLRLNNVVHSGRYGIFKTWKQFGYTCLESWWASNSDKSDRSEYTTAIPLDVALSNYENVTKIQLATEGGQLTNWTVEIWGVKA